MKQLAPFVMPQVAVTRQAAHDENGPALTLALGGHRQIYRRRQLLSQERKS
jgi:hypothetical protein